MKKAQLRVAGLWSSPNPYSAPEGAMRTFNNVVVSDGGLIRARRGRTTLTTAGGGPITKTVAVNNTILSFNNGAIKSYHDPTDAVTVVAVSGNSPPNDKRTSVAKTSQFIYLTTDSGVKRMNSEFTPPIMAGLPIPTGFDLENSSVTGSPGFLADSKTVGYICLFGYRFRNTGAAYEGQTQFGPVSGRMLISNSSGVDKNVTVRVTIPKKNNSTSDLDPDTYFVQLYRTESSDSGTDPGGHMFLCAEQFLTSGDIGLGYVDILDDTPDIALGEELYTNSNMAGEQNTNFPPPFANELVYFKDHLFYLNCEYRHRLQLSLLSTDSASGGLANGDDIVIGGITFTGKDSPGGAGSYEFRRYEIGGSNDLGSIGLNLEATAHSLCHAVNRDHGSIYAYYASKSDELERGKIVLMVMTDTAGEFAASSSVSRDYWAPQVPQTGGTPLNSSAAGGQNYIVPSRRGFPEAVPPIGLIPVGGEPHILKGVVQGDNLWIFKQDGLWRLTGDDVSNFRLILVDPTFRLLSPECAAVIGGDLYALGHGGLHIINEAGPKSVSVAVQDDLNALIYNAAGLDAVYDKGFLVPYESEGLLILALPSTSSSNNCDTQYVYHVKTGIWSTWSMPMTHAVVSNWSDKLFSAKYLGLPSNDNSLLRERKSGTVKPGGSTDYQDEGGIAIPVSVEWLPQSLGTLSNQKRFIRASFLLTQQPTITLRFSTELQTGTSFTISSLSVGMANTLIDAARGASLSILLTCSVTGQIFELAASEVEFYEYEGRTR